MLSSNLSDTSESRFLSLGELRCEASKRTDIRVSYEPCGILANIPNRPRDRLAFSPKIVQNSQSWVLLKLGGDV
jgi:hypothetical protein